MLLALRRIRYPPLTSVQKAVVHSGNTFGLNLFKDLNKATAGHNLLVSPLSVSMALGMALNGARGSTRDGMEQTLTFTGLSSDDINATYSDLIGALTSADPAVQMQIANSIWYKPVLIVEQSFLDANTTYFNALVRSIDFSQPSSAGTINAWVSDNTHGKIPTIVPDPIPIDIVMYLINGVYFKGTWTRKFDSTATRDELFTKSDGSTEQCGMMRGVDTVNFMNANGVLGVDIPYGQEGFSMTLLLPPSGTTIDDFIAGISSERWESWTSSFAVQPVMIYLPKFKLSYMAVLNQTLTDLGMGLAFTDAADFTGIDKRGSLAISEVIHKTFVQVDESGTEAAGATLIGIRATSTGGGDGVAVIRLDRPFVYVIREHVSGSILFIGKLAVPSWSQE